MYHRVLRSKIISAFKELNKKNIEPVIGAFASKTSHSFIGTHALAGTRTNKDSIRRWYERLHELFPVFTFELKKIEISGGPWKTLVAVHWIETNTGSDGVEASNSGLNLFVFRWGKIQSLDIYTDTVLLTKALERLHESGSSLAKAPPITDSTY